jgi:3-isopropylmalate/(R)-2-methylmalate dehydratase small subunit
MPSTPFRNIDGRYVILEKDDIDTDQIIPARFLKTVDRDGLGVHAFNDWRYDATGEPRPDFVLNRRDASGAEVLVAGRNFGCGSSREHAVWALMASGFRAVVSTAFADIFRGNALGNGLLPLAVDESVIRMLIDARARNAEARVQVDLASQTLTLPDGRSVNFPIAPFAKRCILEGVDEIDVLVGEGNQIDTYEATHPPAIATTAEAGR